MRTDTKVWLKFLKGDPMAVCRPFVDLSKSLVADQIFFFTDAAGSKTKEGIGCVYASNWCYTSWEKHFIENCRPSIRYLELYAIMVAIHLWVKSLSNTRVIIFCDNLSIVHALNNSTSNCPNCLILLRRIMLTSVKYNVRFFCRHVEGATNTLANKLLRGNIDLFWKHVKQLYISVNP